MSNLLPQVTFRELPLDIYHYRLAYCVKWRAHFTSCAFIQQTRNIPTRPYSPYIPITLNKEIKVKSHLTNVSNATYSWSSKHQRLRCKQGIIAQLVETTHKVLRTFVGNQFKSSHNSPLFEFCPFSLPFQKTRYVLFVKYLEANKIQVNHWLRASHI